MTFLHFVRNNCNLTKLKIVLYVLLEYNYRNCITRNPKNKVKVKFVIK